MIGFIISTNSKEFVHWCKVKCWMQIIGSSDVELMSYQRRNHEMCIIIIEFYFRISLQYEWKLLKIIIIVIINWNSRKFRGRHKNERFNTIMQKYFHITSIKLRCF